MLAASACGEYGMTFSNPFAWSEPNLQSRAENSLFAALADFPQCRRTAQPHILARVFTPQVLQGANHIGQRFVRRNTGSPWRSQFMLRRIQISEKGCTAESGSPASRERTSKFTAS